MWLRIDGRPSRQYYRDARDPPYLAAGVARHELLKSAGTIRSAVDGETPNITVTLRSRPGLFVAPPIGAQATLFDAGATIFAGIVRSIEIDTEQEECRIGVEP